MKLAGIVGTGSGKMGNAVFSVVGGAQIVRQYQPNVANPSTLKQINVRARLKLLSQLAAVYAPTLAFTKDGLKSARNQFIEKNFINTYANGGSAQVTYENLQLTPGNLGLPSISADRAQATGLVVQMGEDARGVASRIAYVVLAKTTENALQFVDSKVIDEAGQDGKFPATFGYIEGDIVIHAYGMRDTNAAATAKYASYQVQSASDLATLVASRSLSLSDYQFTRTHGASMANGVNSIEPIPAGKARVYVTATDGGTATGAGLFDLGSQVTVTATPNAGNDFVGWYRNGASQLVSAAAEYTFTLTQQTDLVARFQRQNEGGGEGTI
ncbi:MAG: hypothetical protein J6U65_05075 [Bacteroidaceae bacterium]|nr:hypothetical protein [Bacteroidaceae bacterium]